MKFEVETLKKEYIPACAAIAATAPDPWQSGAFGRILQEDNRPCFVVVSNGEPVAFAAFLQVCETADLELVAVREDQRRRGLGRALLGHALATLARQGATRVLLEVRESNTAAIALYQKLGFAVLARRASMYSQPKEDGFLMAVNCKNELDGLMGNDS